MQLFCIKMNSERHASGRHGRQSKLISAAGLTKCRQYSGHENQRHPRDSASSSSPPCRRRRARYSPRAQSSSSIKDRAFRHNLPGALRGRPPCASRRWPNRSMTEVSGKLEAKLPARVPVVITPDIGIFNGYTNPFPYMHIVLYDSALDIGWTAFKDNFRDLFLHELTHAVSLQIKAPWASFLSGIFGSWVLPGLLNAPEFMVEGVAVSFESADGIGRPRQRSPDQGAIAAGHPREPLQVSHRGLGPLRRIPLWRYLLRIWRPLQRLHPEDLRDGQVRQALEGDGRPDLPDLPRPLRCQLLKAFHKTYGIPFMEAWADFRNAVALAVRVAAPERIGPRDLAAMPGGLAGDGQSLYWVDARSDRAMMMQASTLESSVLFDADSSWAISDVSRDGGARKGASSSRGPSCSRTAVPAPRPSSTTSLEALPARDRRTPTCARRASSATAWVGIVSNLHNTDLVFAPRRAQKLLLPGLGGGHVFLSRRPRRGAYRPHRRDRREEEHRRYSTSIRADSRLVKPTGADAELLDLSSGSLSARRDSGATPGCTSTTTRTTGSTSSASSTGRSFRVETTEYSGGMLWPASRAAASSTSAASPKATRSAATPETRHRPERARCHSASRASIRSPLSRRATRTSRRRELSPSSGHTAPWLTRARSICGFHIPTSPIWAAAFAPSASFISKTRRP